MTLQIKFLICWWLTLPPVFAYKLAVGAGGITPHYENARVDYCKKIDDRGTIYNNVYYLRLTGTSHAATVLTGEDSICSEIYGAFYTYLFWGPDHFWELNLTLGGYTYDQSDWDQHDQNTPSGYNSVEVPNVNVDGFRFVPIAAIEINFAIARGKNWALKQNNLLSYFLSNHSVSFEYAF